MASINRRCRLSALLRAKSGVAAIEFALIAPVLFMILFAILEFGAITFMDVVTNGAVNGASRTGTTGYTPAGMSRETYLKGEITRYTSAFINPDLIEIEALAYGSFEDVNQPEPFTDEDASGDYTPGEPFTDVNGDGQWNDDMGIAGYGGPGQVVAYTVRYPYNVVTPLLWPILGYTYTIESVWVVRNEPADG